MQTQGDWAPVLPVAAGERRFYRALREQCRSSTRRSSSSCALWAAFGRSARTGALRRRSRALQTVPVNGMNRRADSFISTYFEQLLTYGNAVGEIVVADRGDRALYNAALEDLEIRLVSPLESGVFVVRSTGTEPCRYPELILSSALNPPPGSAGHVDFEEPAVCQRGSAAHLPDDRHQLGAHGQRALRRDLQERGLCERGRPRRAARRGVEPRDAARRERFRGGGRRFDPRDRGGRAADGERRAGAADAPSRSSRSSACRRSFLGLSWSSTERMSSQQADMLTSELTAYRRIFGAGAFEDLPHVAPAERLLRTRLRSTGTRSRCRTRWTTRTRRT